MATGAGPVLSFLLYPPQSAVLPEADGEDGTAGREIGGALRRALRRSILGAVLAGLLVLGASKAFFGSGSRTDQAYSPDHQRLLDSLGATRPIEARLSREIPHSPYRRPSAFRVRAEITRAIGGANEREPSPENRATLAILHLVEGRPDAAVQLLRKAHAQKPDDPRFLNDLAAALLAVNEATGDPWPALEAFELARESKQSELSLPALFNQALALTRLGLRARAPEAWRRYLEQEASSAWAEEAARRLERLERKVSNGPNPWAERQRGEVTLLTRWAEQTLAGRTDDAEAALAEAEALAASLTAGGGRLLAASAAAIRDAEKVGDRVRIERLARGHQAFGQAFLRWREEQAGVALALLDDAIRDLQAAESPFELRARVLHAQMATEPDWAELRNLEMAAETKGFPSITAEARCITAFRISLEGRLEAAIDVYQYAQRRFEKLGEWEKSAVIAAMVTELLGLLSRERESAPELITALTAGPSMAEPWNRYSVYVVAASAVVGRFSRAAVELRLEAADVCRNLPERPLCEVDSWLRVAALTPDAAVAQDALHRAGELLPTTPSSDGKTRTEIDLATSRARWLAGDDSSTADLEEVAKLLSQAAEGYESKGLTVPAARTRAARAQILQRLGLPEEASAEYRAGLRLFRRWDQRDRFRPENAEKRSPRELREVYEELLKIELDAAGEKPSPAAFLLSEEMRDRLAPRRSAELWLPGRADVDRFAAVVPPGTAVVEYAVFGEQAVAWILAGGRLDQVALAPQTKLGERIRSLTRRRNVESWKSTSGTLFQDLLAPVLKRLPTGTERLVLVPDSELYSLPFRALWDPGSGRYLDESFTIALAPSVRQYLGFGEVRSAAPKHRGLPVLSLGWKTFLPDLGLKPLPRAEEEAAAVLEVHGGVADCPVIDWASFRQCAPRVAVLHLATHASADSSRSERTWLAFERETVNLDRLWRELPDLPQRPLVVLSACQSAATAGGGEGLGGLARPFLASGARAVVGTLWKIDDEDAASLFPAFHRTYWESGNSAEALRKARTGFENWSEKPWIWGGMEVVSAEP